MGWPIGSRDADPLRGTVPERGDPQPGAGVTPPSPWGAAPVRRWGPRAAHRRPRPGRRRPLRGTGLWTTCGSPVDEVWTGAAATAARRASRWRHRWWGGLWRPQRTHSLWTRTDRGSRSVSREARTGGAPDPPPTRRACYSGARRAARHPVRQRATAASSPPETALQPHQQRGAQPGSADAAPTPPPRRTRPCQLPSSTVPPLATDRRSRSTAARVAVDRRARRRSTARS